MNIVKLDTGRVFHPDLIARIIEVSEDLCAQNKQVLRPQLASALGLDPSSQEVCCMISLIFNMDLIPGFKLSKGRNGGIKKVKEQTTQSAPQARRCSICDRSGHNSRTCPKNISNDILNEDDSVPQSGTSLICLPEALSA